MTHDSEFSRLPLAEQYRRLEWLRVAVVLLTSGDSSMIDRLLAGVESPATLPDGAEVAEDVARWLEAQE